MADHAESEIPPGLSDGRGRPRAPRDCLCSAAEHRLLEALTAAQAETNPLVPLHRNAEFFAYTFEAAVGDAQRF